MKNPLTNDLDLELKNWHTCTRCQLHTYRTQVVLGSGNFTDPKIMIIGQAPEKIEDKKGKPFISKVSWHLDQALKTTKIDREKDCYMTNSIACRSWIPWRNENVPPSMTSIHHCRKRLLIEYNKIKNSLRAIVLVGKEAYIAWHLYDQINKPSFNPNRIRMTNITGWSKGIDDIKTYTLYHPSYIAKENSAEIAKKWLDNWVEISSSVFPERFS
jgi:uracil-DNA glycosylase family 4